MLTLLRLPLFLLMVTVFKIPQEENDRSCGGVGVMYKSIMRTKLMDANKFRSFEFSEWNVMIQNQVIKLVGVYRPPSSTNYPQPVSLFFE